MRFKKGLTLAAVCAVGLGGALAPAAGHAQADARSASTRSKTPKPSPATERGPTAVEILNKSLNPGETSNPDVPLPHPGLANVGPGPAARSGGAQVYGRQEEGGGVLGLRMPIPVDRGSSAGTTRYGSSPAGGANGSESR